MHDGISIVRCVGGWKVSATRDNAQMDEIISTDLQMLAGYIMAKMSDMV